MPYFFLRITDDKLIFSVPNTGYVAHRKRLLFGSFPLQWRNNPGEHLRFWTLGDMKWWLKQLNLYEKSIIKTYEGFPLLNKLWPGMFAMGIIVIIKKIVCLQMANGVQILATVIR